VSSGKPDRAIQLVEYPFRVNPLLLFSGEIENVGVRMRVIQKLETKLPELWLNLYIENRD